MTHPKVREEFLKNHVQIPLNAPDINEEEFFRQTLPDTRKVAVNHVIRLLRGEKEYVLVDKTITGNTLEGNTRYLTKRFGSYPFPFFVKAYNPATGRSEANGKLDRTEDRFEIPSSPATLKKIFAEDEFGTNTGMTIDIGGMQIAVMSKKDFIELPADKLVSKITGKEIGTIVGTPQAFVTTKQEDEDEDDEGKGRGNSEQQQKAARERMYDVSYLNSASTFGPTEEQKAAAQPTLAPQPVLNVTPSLTPSPMPQEEQEQEEKVEQQAEVTSTSTGKAGQSRAKERISENVGVVLKHEDTGVKENMTKDSITIEEPQGQAAKDLMDRDRQQKAAKEREKESKR